MLSSQCPMQLWDDCLEFQALIHSNMALDIYELQGEVPETIVSGETSDISQFFQHYWYEWIMFRDTAVSFPDNKLVLGWCLGPSIDVGPAMTAKILTKSGEVVHRSTYASLTKDEMDDPDKKDECRHSSSL